MARQGNRDEALGIDDTAEVPEQELEQMVQSAASVEVSAADQADEDEVPSELALDDTAVVAGGDMDHLVEQAARIDVSSTDS